MATLRTALQIYDGMTRPLQNIAHAMDIVLNSFEAIQTASGNAVDTSAIREAREELARTETALDGIERNIRENEQQQQRFNNSIQAGNNAANGLWGKIKGIAATIGTMIGINKVLGLSDELAGAKARLSLIVDDGGSVLELEQKIMRSAQRARAAYTDTLQTVGKLGLMAGKAFSGNDEMIRFAELMNKNFIIAGASAQEQSSAMYQLTQAMASGRLQGDEYRSIIENAPLLAGAIEDYMRNVQGAEGSMKDWASEGLLTADVIKNALFSSADEIETRFEKMPKTWAQIWTGMQNKAISIFNPILNKLNELANSERFTRVTDGIINGLAAIGAIAAWVFDLMITIGSGIADNWSWIEPVLWGIIAALLIYNGVSLVTNTITGISTFMKNANAAATAFATGWIDKETKATWANVTAQYGLNAALYACPLTWIILLIIAIIALFYAAVAAVNHFAGTSVSATGIICGAFMVALAFIGNIFVALWNLVVDVFVLIYNLVAEVANFIGNVFTDPIGAVCRLFFGLADTVLGILQALASAIDAIFGSNLAGSVQGWRDSLGGWVDDTFGKGDEIMAKMNADDLKLGRFEYSAAYDLGYNFGQGIDDKVSGLFDFQNMDSLDAYGLGNSLDGIYSNTGDTAGNTAAMADALEITEEDLSYLRDIAERDAINRFTTAEIKVEQHNENHISSDADIDGILDAWAYDFAEKLENSPEGVHE